MMARILGSAALILAVAAGAECRAESYDGKWLLVIPGVSVRCPDVNVHVTVTGQRIAEEAGTARFTYKLFGALAPDGTFDITSPGGQGHSKGKFSGNTLAADFTNSECGTRAGTGSKEQ